MRNAKGFLHPRAVSLADIADKENLIRIVKDTVHGGSNTTMAAIPVPRAGRPQPVRTAGHVKGKSK
jgi:hypothetical protein